METMLHCNSKRVKHFPSFALRDASRLQRLDQPAEFCLHLFHPLSYGRALGTGGSGGLRRMPQGMGNRVDRLIGGARIQRDRTGNALNILNRSKLLLGG